jgi:hypothetical protein
VKPVTQEEVFHRMSPAERLRAAERLYWSARSLKTAALRARHPEWSEDRIERTVRELFLFHRG